MTAPQKTCLIVLAEDVDVVAVDLHDTLAPAGYAVAGPFSTCAAAISWLANATPDMAVLSRVLQDGTCERLAAELKERGVPFLIFSPPLESGIDQALHWKPARQPDSGLPVA
jgi:DNA-binding response OmpR family regulator